MWGWVGGGGDKQIIVYICALNTILSPIGVKVVATAHIIAIGRIMLKIVSIIYSFINFCFLFQCSFASCFSLTCNLHVINTDIHTV